MKILFDTNIILDIFLARQPFLENAAKLFAKVEQGKLEGVLGATTITTLYYLISKQLGKKQTKQVIEKLLNLFEIGSVDHFVLRTSLSLDFPDYEDTVLYQVALHNQAQGIVTRDRQGFGKGTLPVYSPEELLQSLNLLENKESKKSNRTN